MDLVYVIVLAVAVIVAVVAVDSIRHRRRRPATLEGDDSELAVSTEGMKVCPNCGMGNLWTDRTCMSCKAPLKG